MSAELTVTVLVENTVARGDLQCEHGLALWVETPKTVGLFDTGQTGECLLHNAAVLGKDFSRLDWIALSHGHYDHCGGLEAVLRQRSDPIPVFVHPEIFLRQCAREEDGSMRDIGMPLGKLAATELGVDWRLAGNRAEIAPDVFVLSEVPLTAPEETVSKRFVRERDGVIEQEDFLHEQLLVIETAAGVVALLGCAHRGLINSIESAAHFAVSKPVSAFVGGTHLNARPRVAVESVLSRLYQNGVGRVGPGHCTGDEAMELFERYWGQDCQRCSAGTVFEF